MDIQTTVKIDWITASHKAEEKDFGDDGINLVSAAKFARSVLKTLLGRKVSIELVAGNAFYEYAFREQTSDIWMQVSSDIQNQGFLITMSGSAKLSDHEREIFLYALIERQFKITRIDVAFDIVNSGARIEDLILLWERTEAKGRKLKKQIIDSAKGMSFYVGSRQSAHMLRVYDKAGEQGLSADWIRVEIELKQYAAEQYAGMICNHPASIAGEIARMLRSVDHPLVNIPMDTAAGILVKRASAPPTKEARERWFIDSVLPAFRTLRKVDQQAALRVYEMLGLALLAQDTDSEEYTLQLLNG